MWHVPHARRVILHLRKSLLYCFATFLLRVWLPVAAGAQKKPVKRIYRSISYSQFIHPSVQRVLRQKHKFGGNVGSVCWLWFLHDRTPACPILSHSPWLSLAHPLLKHTCTVIPHYLEPARQKGAKVSPVTPNLHPSAPSVVRDFRFFRGANQSQRSGPFYPKHLKVTKYTNANIGVAASLTWPSNRLQEKTPLRRGKLTT